MVTLSVIKADVGGFVGHCGGHPRLLDEARERLDQAKRRGLLVDSHVMQVGDDLELIMTHGRGTDNPEIHKLAWDTFQACTALAKELKLHAAGQDLLKDSFTGTVSGMGPGVAELSFEERQSEPVLVFMADKTAAGAWNLPLYKAFADPFNTIGLVIAPSLHAGFRFEVHDVVRGKRVTFSTPEESYDLLVFLGAPGRYIVKAVSHKQSGEIGAVTSTQRVNLLAGRYVGKDDPVCVVRCQGVFPAMGEVLEPFSQSPIVQGWMRGSHHGPLMPVCFGQAHPNRFDGPPRVVAAGFQITEGRLLGPQDMFDDPSFDEARHRANEFASYLRQQGPFEPHRLPLEEMEYTTLPDVLKKLEGRFEDIPAAERPSADPPTRPSERRRRARPA